MIAKKVKYLRPDGSVKAIRTLYYKTYSSDCKPIMCGRSTAADLPPETAETVLRQLNQLHGGGFEIVAQ